MNFHYGDKVRVTSGFYEGMEGICKRIKTEEIQTIKKGWNVGGELLFGVEIESALEYRTFLEFFPKSDLELIK